MTLFRLPRLAIALCAFALIVAAPVIGQTPPGTASSAAPVASSTELAGAKLLAALRKGGYVLYFRHASTDFGANDDAMTSFEDCTKQRNLTDTGRDEARAIGTAIRRLDLPIGDVLASPYCRTMETATLIFGRATATPAVRGGPAQAESARYADLTKLLSTPVPGGRDRVIVSHGNPFRAVAGGSYLAEGEAAIIEPLGAAKFRIVARVRKDEWAGLP